MKKTSVDLPEDLWRETRVWAAFKAMTMGALVTKALEAYIADLKRRTDIDVNQTGEEMVKRLIGRSQSNKKKGG